MSAQPPNEFKSTLLDHLQHCLFPGMIVGSVPTTEGCRVAPYVNMPSLRMAFDRIHMQHLGHLDLAAATAAASAATAAAANPLAGLPGVPAHSPGSVAAAPPPGFPSMLFYPTPHYAVNFAALAQNGLLANKNSSIADLRLKAKHHAASLGLS